MAEPSRPRADDIYARVAKDASDELVRPASQLLFSGLFAGFTVGAGPLLVAIVLATLEGDATWLIAYLFYPVGYLSVILGRAQFFTENTLYPVMHTLRKPSAWRPTARLWALVYGANLLGVALFAALVTQTPALETDVLHELTELGASGVEGSFAKTFWSGVIAGWILAQVAWLVEATVRAIAQVAVIWALTLVVGLGGFDHCIATTVGVFSALFDGGLGTGQSLEWLAAATLGNIAGGVLLVSILNYGQIRED